MRMFWFETSTLLSTRSHSFLSLFLDLTPTLELHGTCRTSIPSSFRWSLGAFLNPSQVPTYVARSRLDHHFDAGTRVGPVSNGGQITTLIATT
ncbi:hypothetical protein JAAARDRAFT_660171 [Jaapia argillacea MUCL 33604]|uniref:Uncharacterized protein n=1 Tax=Jaapia argillacea MUCL 33604 TaxID=933084 RepID=A0A067Q9T5_9AGAM|nr:hypothetical protein JAAARDRAFT_660171 [Jaapia argillacea MUCL 33604]